MNTVGPYHNRQETYAYFSLPFCSGSKDSISHYHETLSEALQGVELEFSGYEIDFNRKLSEVEGWNNDGNFGNLLPKVMLLPKLSVWLI